MFLQGSFLVLLASLLALVHTRVNFPPTRIKSRHTGYSVNHPVVLTLPPTYRPIFRRPTTTSAPLTTPEPPEVEEPEFTTNSWYNTGYNNYGFNMYRGTTAGYFGFPFFNQPSYVATGGSSAGGASPEDVWTPAPDPTPRPKQQRRQRRPVQQKQWVRRVQQKTTPPQATAPPQTTPLPPPPPTTTTAAAPTTPEAPEAEDVSGAYGVTDATGFGGNSGYCFCSILSQCPSSSVRRGACSNALTDFFGLGMIRCCYRPSVAKRLGL